MKGGPKHLKKPEDFSVLSILNNWFSTNLILLVFLFYFFVHPVIFSLYLLGLEFRTEKSQPLRLLYYTGNFNHHFLNILKSDRAANYI